MDIQDELNERLRNWAYWIIPFENNEVGYPRKSTIADFGVTTAYVRQSKPPFPLNNIQAQEMDCWIQRMGQEKYEYKLVIGAYYLSSGGDRIFDLAKTYKITPHMFKKYLREARIWLRGRMSIEK